MPILILFILVPIIELYLLIKVGSLIGVIPTLLIVILTAVIGTALLRQQGLATLQRYQRSLAEGRMPAQEVMEGLALVFGGALLLTPGFFTDAIGFLCLFPLTRKAMIRAILRRVNFSFFGVSGHSVYTQHRPQDDDSKHGRGRTLEGEYSVDDQDDHRRH